MKIINPKKPVEMFIKAGLFCVFFLIVLVFFMIASKNVKSVDPGSSILNGVTRYKGFGEKEKEDLKARNAGFWQFDSDTGGAMNVSDRFELKTNGIFWEVTRCQVGLPSGKTAMVMHVITGYMNPFTMLASNNKDSILCDVHTIKQAYIMGADTCYAPSGEDTTWVVVADGRRLSVMGRAYCGYDTSGQALHTFFPEGALAVVDKIALMQCPGGGSFAFYLKKAITSDMASVKVQSLTIDNIQKILDAYYRYFIESIVAGSFQGAKTKNNHLTVAFDVGSDGKAGNARVKKISASDARLERLIVAEINSWIFPGQGKAAATAHIEREFWF
jgi:hypothetical protein